MRRIISPAAFVQLWKFLAVIFLLSFMIVNSLWIVSNNGLRDFGSFVASGRAVARGLNPYNANSPLVFQLSFPSLGLNSNFPNMNPPITLYLFELLADLDPYWALQGWRLFSIILYITALGLLIKAHPQLTNKYRVFWALSLGGFWHTLELGQIYIPLLLACVVSWLLISHKRYFLSGILIGFVIAIKPNFIIWPLFLLLVGNWTVGLFSFITIGFLMIIPILSFSPSIYSQWLEAVVNFSGLSFPANNSIIGLMVRFNLLWLGSLLSVIVFLIMAVWIWHNKFSELYTSAIAITLSLLISPISWSGYTIFLLPIFFERKWGPLLRISSIILVVPVVFILGLFQLSFTNFIIFGWFYGWALLLVLTALILEQVPLNLHKLISNLFTA